MTPELANDVLSADMGSAKFVRCLVSVQREAAHRREGDLIAQSLRNSAAIFRAAGKTFSADFTDDMARQAAEWPCLYAHWADQQALRARDALVTKGDI